MPLDIVDIVAQSRPSSRIISRRAFIAGFIAAAAASSLSAEQFPAFADDVIDIGDPLPQAKTFDPEWLESLTRRGSPKIYTGSALQKIGMPIGGLCAGQLYLGGDGRLWRWNIFNQPIASPGEGQWYLRYPDRDFPIDQGFFVRVGEGSSAVTRNLDSTGFSTVAFRGEYPIGRLEFSDVSLPINAKLKAYSPFIPLDFDRSSFPATIFRYTIKNTSTAPVTVTVGGWLQNAVCLFSAAKSSTQRNNSIVKTEFGTVLACGLSSSEGIACRPDIIFEEWKKSSYEGWTVEGAAFGSGPRTKADVPSYMGVITGGDNDRWVNSHVFAPGSTPEERDSATGKLTSAPFVISRNYVAAWISGGDNPGSSCINVVVDGTVVATATGANSNELVLCDLDVKNYFGKTASIEIVDNATGAWGNIGVGGIKFTDVPSAISQASDYGTMALTLLGGATSDSATRGGATGLNAGFAEPSMETEGQTLVGALARTVPLKPGESAEFDFIISWHFQNLHLDRLGLVGNYYGTKFDTATAVSAAIASEFDLLTTKTELWNATWYDSTLPYWFLDRTFGNTAVLATTTALRFANGRFYGWEGIGLGVGTVTHVWHYAHAVARLFPELERDTRQRVDLGIALVPDSGVIEYRAEFDNRLAIDGQAGTLLRCYREHQMTTNNDFLTVNWPNIKHAYDPLFNQDKNLDGIIEGPQLNTLDFNWYGQISWLSSLYVAALRAGEAMASEMGDTEFQTKCRTVAESGTKNITARLFNGEYFYNLIDPAHPESLNSGSGCEIDQVMGQSWAFKVGLPRVLPQAETITALKSLFKYNFATDVGPYRKIYPQGRWYAVPGEGGMFVATFPRADWTFKQAIGTDSAYAAGYFNECQSGYEHNAAGHMISEGLVTQGLVVERAIHDRYDGAKRNPWNEIEYGDHYARSMASYGVFLAATGYQYHGPKQTLTFAPQINAEDAKFAFTTAEAWGSYSQKITVNSFRASIRVQHGKLPLTSLTVVPKNVRMIKKTEAKIASLLIPLECSSDGSALTLSLPKGTVLLEHQTLELILT